MRDEIVVNAKLHAFEFNENLPNEDIWNKVITADKYNPQHTVLSACSTIY